MDRGSQPLARHAPSAAVRANPLLVRIRITRLSDGAAAPLCEQPLGMTPRKNFHHTPRPEHDTHAKPPGGVTVRLDERAQFPDVAGAHVAILRSVLRRDLRCARSGGPPSATSLRDSRQPSAEWRCFQTGGQRRVYPVACSKAKATCRARRSRPGGAITCNPRGIPESEKPQGTVVVGKPTRGET